MRYIIALLFVLVLLVIPTASAQWEDGGGNNCAISFWFGPGYWMPEGPGLYCWYNGSWHKA